MKMMYYMYIKAITSKFLQTLGFIRTCWNFSSVQTFCTLGVVYFNVCIDYLVTLSGWWCWEAWDCTLLLSLVCFFEDDLGDWFHLHDYKLIFKILNISFLRSSCNLNYLKYIFKICSNVNDCIEIFSTVAIHVPSWITRIKMIFFLIPSTLDYL